MIAGKKTPIMFSPSSFKKLGTYQIIDQRGF